MMVGIQYIVWFLGSLLPQAKRLDTIERELREVTDHHDKLVLRLQRVLDDRPNHEDLVRKLSLALRGEDARDDEDIADWAFDSEESW